jgi:hypothetical protein
MIYKGYKACGQDYVTKHRYCLILPERDDYTHSSQAYKNICYRTYTLEGCSMGTVVDYMTKNKMAI